jgi:hypothetical protein
MPTTTEHLQVNPDYYTTIEECKKKHKKVNTNPRYENFTQTHFTAGDHDQFDTWHDKTNGSVCMPKIDISRNIFGTADFGWMVNWSKYANLTPQSVDNTFAYIFNKFKKGTYVKIQNNELKVFLPFSKKNFVNEWSNMIKIDPKYGKNFGEALVSFAQYINKLGGKTYRVSVNKFADNWYANNCLVRFEYPINEGDTNVSHMSDMLKQLCANRTVPDIEFFMNRRDFPLIKRDDTEPYEHIFGHNHPLVSHLYDKYSPILSMVTTSSNADIPIPTSDDWERVMSYEGKYFAPDCAQYPTEEDFNVKWDKRKPTAVFRGASTGCGVTIDTNPRLKLAFLSANTPAYEGIPLLDAGISKWQLRPRKLDTEKYLQTIDVPIMNSMGIQLASFLTPKQQAEYKYLVHVDGHVSAFRLGLEMSMGCCILKVDSKYTMWFTNMMKPMYHYIPIKSDLSDLVERLKWCRANDKVCKKIASNAKLFYKEYLQKNGILDYLQQLLIDMKKHMGVYLYNTESPLDRQIGIEKDISLTYPKSVKLTKNSIIGKIPPQARSVGLLRGLEWVINKVLTESSFEKVAIYKGNIFSNKNVMIKEYEFASFPIIVKETKEREKIKENIHEAYIGINAINDMLKYVPNFAYVFGKYEHSHVIMEKISGVTLDKWLNSASYNMKDFIFILIQLSLALNVAQRDIGFVHYDLTPWNIIIQEIPNEVEFDYIISIDEVYRVSTRIIPIMIDYGKSHVIIDDVHFGYVNMYKMSTIQDIISLLITSLNTIIQNKNISKSDVVDCVTLGNFLTGGGYKKIPFRQSGPLGVSDLQFFIKKAKKYEELISSDKYDLESKGPIDLITYIENKFRYKFDYRKLNISQDTVMYKLNRGNPRQVFEFILAQSDSERVQSFINVFKRINECQFPDTGLFMSYFAIQSIEENFSSVNLLFLYYMKDMKIKIDITSDYENTVSKLQKYYDTVIKKRPYTIEYDTDGINEDVSHIAYTSDSFSDPSYILSLISSIKNKYVDFSEYKHIIQRTLLNKSKFAMTSSHREFYMSNFKELMKASEVSMKTNAANVKTLSLTAEGIYSTDKLSLIEKLGKSKGDCRDAKKYLKIYDNVLNTCA